MSELPENYGTPEYEAAWMREKLNLPADAKTSKLQGAIHVVCYEAHSYDRYIKAHKCDDKQGEIARQSVQIAELQVENARLLQRAARAELLVRLLQCGAVIFNLATEIVFTATEELPYDHTTWTDEQWERLEQLESEATDER
jgi:hypothetical protein